MQMFVKDIFKNPGFIIKIENNGYGKNYQFDTTIDILPGDVFLLSYIKEYRLIQITDNYSIKVIEREKQGNKIFNIIKGVDKS